MGPPKMVGQFLGSLGWIKYQINSIQTKKWHEQSKKYPWYTCTCMHGTVCLNKFNEVSPLKLLKYICPFKQIGSVMFVLDNRGMLKLMK